MYSHRLYRAYPSDLTDEQWELLKPLIPPLSPDAAYWLHERREIVNGILLEYVLRAWKAAWQALLLGQRGRLLFFMKEIPFLSC